MAEIKELKLTVPWGHISAKAWGSLTNFPVLCVHGLLDNAGAFDRLIAQLPEHYYYISIDLPGHGLSSHFPSGLQLHFFDYILALRYIVEEFKWKSFHYMGHSLGGQLGLFYSIVYPDQIQRMILIEGAVPRIIPEANLIARIKEVQDATIEAKQLGEDKHRLYTRDEVMYALTFNRGVCLNNKAAQAIFTRSVSKVEDKFQYNRDFRLKSYVIPLFNFDQISYILSQIKVKTILFITKGTLESYPKNNRSILTNVAENMNNTSVIYVEGNHDIHNNYPERISSDIATFLNSADVISKL